MKKRGRSGPPRTWADVLAVAVVAVGLPVASFAASAFTQEHEARLMHLLRHDCGSCHGMTMRGGLGPALLPETLAEYDEESLVQIILSGNPDRAMPPWAGLLDEAEARWIVRRLKEGLAP